MQKKTFTKWVNSHLARVTCRVGDLYSDLRDGRNLLRLLEVLSGETLVSFGDERGGGLRNSGGGVKPQESSSERRVTPEWEAGLPPLRGWCRSERLCCLD